jgi:hypothetical protein
MDSQLKAQCKAVVGIATGSTVDFAGQVQVGSTATYYCRVEPRYREIYRSGVMEKTTHMLIVPEELVVTEAQSREMLIWMPGVSLATISEARRALIVSPCYDENNVLDHWEILV